MTQIRVVGFIALAILLLAIANFVNLATARASERAKEVGINKVLGASRGLLVRRYTAEALILAGAAGVASLGATWFVIPLFNRLADTHIALEGLADWRMVVFFAAILAITGWLAGIWPAHVLARMAPLGLTREAQSGRNKTSTRVRQGLVIFQFCITGILLISAFVVHRQLRFMQEKDLGFEQEQVLILRVQNPSRQMYESLRQEFLAQTGVLKVAAASTVMGSETGSATFATPEMPHETPANFAKTISVSPEFLDLMGVPLVQGRGFRPDGTDPRDYFIVNETLVKRFQLADPLTAAFGWHGEGSGKILGVMKDFHFASVAVPITPLVLYVTPEGAYRYLFLKIEGRNIAATIAAIETGWKKHIPDFPPDYFFQDAHFRLLYAQQEQVRSIASLFSGIAIVLALLGLLGLSVFTVGRRTKEIGIRKVLGASVASITNLLVSDFLKLVLIAFIIASPLAWYIMQQWLSGFAYRIDLPWWIFAGAGLSAVAVAFLSVSFQSIRAALANPVRSLKSE
jgi:putative ABC transport system permease protein